MEYILFVCYDATISNEVAQILADRGHSVLKASNGLEGFRVIREQEKLPKAIFVQINMPEMDGFEFTMAFNRKFPDAETQVLLSVNTISHVLFHQWRLPVDNFVMEPYTKWQILFSVEQLLNRKIIRPTECRWDNWAVG